MPSLVLKNGMVFGYTDSGIVSAGGVDYTTLIIIHGHTSQLCITRLAQRTSTHLSVIGTFQCLHAQAQANSLPIISVN
jgi:hypothetical protein